MVGELSTHLMLRIANPDKENSVNVAGPSAYLYQLGSVVDGFFLCRLYSGLTIIKLVQSVTNLD
jgi:hypothetical protein